MADWSYQAYRTYHPIKAEYTFFSSIYTLFSRIGHTIGDKANSFIVSFLKWLLNAYYLKDRACILEGIYDYPYSL